MATQVLEPMRFGCGVEIYRTYTDAASQSYKQNQFVYMHTDGTIKECADDATVILGMATHDATTVTGADTKILIATDLTFFIMNVYHSSIGSAVSAVANLDQKWGLEVDSNRCYLDVGQTSADALQMFDFVDAVGDTYGKVLAGVLPAAQQWGAASTDA